MDNSGKYSHFIHCKLKLCTLLARRFDPPQPTNFGSSWLNQSLCQRTHTTQLRGKRETLLIFDPFTLFFLLHSIKELKISDGFDWFFQINRLGAWIFPFLWGFHFSSLFCASLSHCSVFPRQICLWGIPFFSSLHFLSFSTFVSFNLCIGLADFHCWIEIQLTVDPVNYWLFVEWFCSFSCWYLLCVIDIWVFSFKPCWLIEVKLGFNCHFIHYPCFNLDTCCIGEYWN